MPFARSRLRVESPGARRDGLAIGVFRGRGRFDIDPRSTDPKRNRSRLDTRAVPTYSPATGETEDMIGTSGLEVSGNALLYLGSAGASQDEAIVVIPCNRAGTASRLWVVASVNAGPGHSWVFRLRKNGEDTAITFAISGENRVGGTGASPTVAFAAGDLLSVKVLGSGAPMAFLNWSLAYL